MSLPRSSRVPPVGNDRQLQPRWRTTIMMHGLGRPGYGSRRGGRCARLQVAIEARKIAPGNLETKAMSALEDHAGRPEVDRNLRGRSARRVVLRTIRSAINAVRYVVG